MAYWKEVTDSYKYGRLIPKLKVVVRHEPLKFSNVEGQLGRLKMLRKTVTALFKHERIELNFARASEARPYAERLIVDAMRYGDCHRPTMEMADFWLEEKQIIHKLFKVLVPRYDKYDTSYTRLYRAPVITTAGGRSRAVLELKGNPFPPVVPAKLPDHFQIHNILLHEAKKEFCSDRSSPDDESSKFETDSFKSFPSTNDANVTEITKNLEDLTTNESK